MNKYTLIGLMVMLASIMTACGGGSGLDYTVSPVAVEGAAQVSASLAGEVELQIDSKSLEVIEICRSDRDCDFRQRCGRLKGTLINHSDRDVTVTGMTRSVVRSNGHVERSRTTMTPNGRFVLKAGEHRLSHGAQCSCAASDRNCTPEYPHRASPFMWGKSERVAVAYTDTHGVMHTVTAESPYTFTRKAK